MTGLDPVTDSLQEAMQPVVKFAKDAFERVQPQIEAFVDSIDMPEELRTTLKDPNTWIVVAGVLLVLFLIAFISLLKPKKRRDAILLLGPVDAGKTTLFHQLRDGAKLPGTVASMQQNEDTFSLKSEAGQRTTPVRVVDVPGHPKVRGLYERYIDNAAGVVFLVDSCDFMPHKTEIAEQLYELLSHPVISSRRLPLLLACNKADQGVKAHTSDFVRKMLEKEIDALRGTRGALGDGSRSAHVALGRRGEPFSFEELLKAQGIKVTLASISALDAAGVGEVETFIRSCVPA